MIKLLPNKMLNSANVQAEIYHRCRLLNMTCILEYTDKENHSRYDIVIFKNEKPICIVEVKNRENGYVNESGRQYKKYSSLGLPLFYCFGFDEIESVVNKIKTLTEEMCPDCSKPLIIRKGPYSSFIGCSGYPKCRFTRSYQEPKHINESCPECKKGLIKRTGKNGDFIACTGFPSCTFTKTLDFDKIKL